jgi:tRNA-dihydrouridine synthase A
MKHLISVAPMMDWTDRHCRYFHRLIAPSVQLYTEMVTTGAIIFGNDRDRFLGFHKAEHPVALQLGGSDPTDLATCAKIAEDYGYDEINLNCGCPSERVQSGSFGACLMREPELVADCIKAMQDAVTIPVTVKSRIGIDDSEDYKFLEDFVSTIADVGCQTFIIHARKAWLKGLSPKENRDIPPLQYDIVERLKQNFPDLIIPVNGGIKTLDDVKEKLEKFDGAMIGREAYQNPWFLRELEEEIYGTLNNASDAQARNGGKELLTAEQVVLKMIPYIKDQQKRFDTPVKSVTRHMTGLFQGRPGARQWRQILSTEVHKDGVTPKILETAMKRAFN